MQFNISWDSSVNSAGSAFKSVVTAVATNLQNIFSDNVTVNITVGFGEVGGKAMGGGALGQSLTYLTPYSYSQIESALSADAKTGDDATAVAGLPGADPTGGGHYWVATADAKALGLAGSSASLDGSVGFSSTAAFDYDDSNGVSAGTYDFYAVVWHELSEVLGRQLLVGGTIGTTANGYEPLDLFHYSAPGVRDFSGTTPGYFSIDGGVQNLNNFNTVSGGDYGDWAASAGHDAALAFSSSGVVNAVTESDLKTLDVIGWDRISVPTLGLNWQLAGTGDFNGDGTADLLWRDTNSGSLSEWLMANGKPAGDAVGLGIAGSNWELVGTGDVNGDHTADLLWRDTGSGQVSEWLMANGKPSGGAVSLGIAGSNWQLLGTGDFNGDHTADLLWRDTNTGQVSEWLMANGKPSGGAINLGAAAVGQTAPSPGEGATTGTDAVLHVGAPGDDVLTGTPGAADTFVFAALQGHHTIEHFTAGEDLIQLDSNDFADFSAVLSHAHQEGADVVIALDAQNTITLKDMELAHLHSSDFFFALLLA